MGTCIFHSNLLRVQCKAFRTDACNARNHWMDQNMKTIMKTSHNWKVSEFGSFDTMRSLRIVAAPMVKPQQQRSVKIYPIGNKMSLSGSSPGFESAAPASFWHESETFGAWYPGSNILSLPLRRVNIITANPWEFVIRNGNHPGY